MFIQIFFLILIKITFGIVFPSTQLQCPTFKNIAGHSSKVIAIDYIPNSVLYASGDSVGNLLINDIKTGETIVLLSSYLIDTDGIQSITSNNNGDVLVISKTEYKVYNIFDGETKLSGQITTTEKKEQYLVQTKLITYYNTQKTSSSLYLITLYSDLVNGITKIGYIDTDYSYNEQFQITIVSTGQQMQGKSDQPSLFVVADNVTGVLGSNDSIYVLLGVSTSGLMYACNIANTLPKNLVDAGSWSGVNIQYQVNTYNHLKGTTIIAVMYGAAAEGSPTITYQNCLVFYDLIYLDQDPTNSSVYQVQRMINTSIKSINQSPTSLIQQIINIYYKDSFYIAFVYPNIIVIYKTNDLISSNYNFSGAINLTMNLQISVIGSIKIVDSSLILVALSNGNVISFDYSAYISSSSTTTSSVSLNQFKFKQQSSGISSTVSDYFYNDSTQQLTLAGATIKSQASSSVQLSQINLSTFVVTNSTLTFSSAESVTSLIVSSSRYFALVLLKEIKYVPKVSGVCPTSSSPADEVTAPQYQLFFNDGQAKVAITLDFSVENLMITQVLDYTSFIFNSDSYIAVLYVIQSFNYNNYCVSSQAQNGPPQGGGGGGSPQGRLLQIGQATSYNIYLFVYNFNGQVQYKSSSPLLTLSSLDQFIELKSDEYSNLVMILNNQLFFIRPYISNSSMNFYSFQVSSSTIQSQAAVLNSSITTSINAFQTLFFIPTLKQFLIQFKLNDNINYVYTCIVSYSQTWTTAVALTMNSIITSKSVDSDNPYTITNLQYKTDTSLLILAVSSDLKIYNFNTSKSKISLYLTINKITSTSTYFYFPFTVATTKLMIIEANSLLQIIDLKDCENNVCNSNTCEVHTYIKQLPSSTSLSDYFNSDSSGYNLRSEYLVVQKWNMFKAMLYLQNTEINYSIYVEQGSSIVWNNQYVSLEDLNSYFSSYLSDNTINLNIQSVDHTLADPKNTVNTFNITQSATQNIEYYNYIQFVNVKFISIVQKSFFKISNLYFILNNVVLLSDKSLSIPIYINTISSLPNGYFVYKNTLIQKQTFNTSTNYISVNTDSYNVILDKITLSQNTFNNTSFLFSNNLLSLTITDSTIEENIIQLTSSINSCRIFITSQYATINKMDIKSNFIENTSIFGLNSYMSRLQWTIQSINLLDNLFLMTDSTTIYVLLFDAQTSESTITSTVALSLTSLERNKYLPCLYSQYQVDKCATLSTASTFSSFYFVALNDIFTTSINQTYDIDNHITFLFGQKSTTVSISEYYCYNTVKTSEIDSPCLYFRDHSKLKFQLDLSYFSNKNIQNNYVIRISSDAYTLGLSTFDGSITLKNSYFNYTDLTTLSSFYKSSVAYIQSLQNLSISLQNITYNNISFSTPQRLFYSQGSCLLLETPFSTLDIEGSTLSNLISYSPSAGLYLNVNQGQITSSTFNYNNFYLSEKTYQGGYVEVQSNKFSVKLSNFTNSISKQGNGFSLVPSSASSSYTFNQCIFQNLIASSNGAAVLMNEALNLTSITFTSCTFSNLLSVKGSGIYVDFTVSSKDKTSFYSYYPSITFLACNSENLFANQGGLVYVENSKLQIDSLISTSNDPNLQIYPAQVSNYILEMNTIGELISLVSSIGTFSNLDLAGFSIYKKKIDISAATTLFLIANSKSTVTISDSQISNCIYLNSGMVLIDSSTLILRNTNITSSKYYVSSSRLLETNINLEVQSKFSAIIIQTQSTIDFTNVLLQNIKCENSLCSGGALIMFNSQGSIKNSVFDSNLAETNGGSLSIINLSGQLTIQNSYFTNSQSTSGNGGGISFLTDQNTNFLVLNDCFVEKNYAKQGGGIYYEFQLDPIASTYISSLINTQIKYNKAKILGGGIFYQGYTPFISSDSIISDNTAESTYGQNSFSYPKKLILNKTLSMEEEVFTYNTYTNSDGHFVYQILNQVSGTALPNLIFQLVDESGALLDKSYLSISSDVTLNITKDTSLSTNSFAISNQITQFAYSDYFNITDLVLTGTPGTSVYLSLTSSSIEATLSSNYKVILEVQLRECVRGEIFSKVTDQSTSTTKTYYKCVKCAQGTYSLAYPDLLNPVEECSKCSPYAFCPGGDEIQVNEGYWRINDQSDEVIECINSPSNCLGGNGNSTCSEGHTGPLCETCDIYNNYTTAGNFKCGSCGDHLTNSLKITGLMIFYIVSAKISVDGILYKLVTYYTIRTHLSKQQIEETEQNTSVLLKLILNYFQIIMVITTFDISVPSFFNGPVDVIASPTTQILYSFECFFYQLYQQTGINMIYIQIISAIILPIICLLIFMISGFITFRKDKFIRGFYLNTSFCYCLMYFQPSIFKNAISLISCRKIGQIKYIQQSLLFECFTDEYMTWSFALVIPIILVIAFFIPLILLYLIQKAKYKKYIIEKRRFMFMILEYQPEAWFWEFIKMNMKLLIMCCLTFYEYDIPNKILFILFIVCFYGFLLLQFKPYRQEVYNKVDILQTAIQGISIYLGFVAYQNYDNLFWWLTAIIIIAVINSVFIIWGIKLLTAVFINKNKIKFEKFKMYLVKFLCCRKYFFSNKSRKYYIKKRWMKSLIKDLKTRNLINRWTGKFKVETHSIFPILQGEVPNDQISNFDKKYKKTGIRKGSNNSNSFVQGEIISKVQFDNQSNKQDDDFNLVKLKNLNVDPKVPTQSLEIISLKSQSSKKNNISTKITPLPQINTTQQDLMSSQTPKTRNQNLQENSQDFREFVQPVQVHVSSFRNNYQNNQLKRNSISENMFDQHMDNEIVSDRQLNEGVNILSNVQHIGDSSQNIYQSQNNSFTNKLNSNNCTLQIIYKNQKKLDQNDNLNECDNIIEKKL